SAVSGDTQSYANALLGKWTSKLSSASGYEFVDSLSVKISLVGFTADGTYSLAMNENGQCEIQINYANLVGVTVSNTYILELTESEMTLVQKNAESVSVTYVKEQ
ncbi:MAG: hypothetical protein UHL70_04190, partial [Acutalibacteraceae bacterium]|nr:hypothetical protein [Acutalibacteraceae bacterium]